MLVPELGALTGWATLAWSGARWFDGRDGRGRRLPVTIAAPDHVIDPRPGLAVSGERLLPGERWLLDGVVLTDPVRSVAFEMRHAGGVREAVRVLDMAAYDDLVSIAAMTDYAGMLTGWTGVGQMRAALRLADENAWSPTEVDARLMLELDLGLPRPLCNRPVFDLDGRHVGTPDLLDAEAGMVVDYDGELHLAGAQRAKDLRRERAFRRLGLEYVTMVAADRHDPADFHRRVLEARQRALATTTRLWTIDPPRWWTPTTTVAERRALTAWQRERFLGNRSA